MSSPSTASTIFSGDCGRGEFWASLGMGTSYTLELVLMSFPDPAGNVCKVKDVTARTVASTVTSLLSELKVAETFPVCHLQHTEDGAMSFPSPCCWTEGCCSLTACERLRPAPVRCCLQFSLPPYCTSHHLDAGSFFVGWYLKFWPTSVWGTGGSGFTDKVVQHRVTSEREGLKTYHELSKDVFLEAFSLAVLYSGSDSIANINICDSWHFTSLWYRPVYLCISQPSLNSSTISIYFKSPSITAFIYAKIKVQGNLRLYFSL